MEVVWFEYISFGVKSNGSMSESEFIAAGISYGWYGEYGYEGQRMLLKEAYRLIREQYEKLLPLIV